MQYDLAGARNIFAQTLDSIAEAPSIQASHVLQGYFIVRNGRIGIRATVENLRKTKAMEHIDLDGPMAGGFLPLANELARRLSSEARTFGNSNENTFRSYGQALEAGGAGAREQALKAAVDMDSIDRAEAQYVAAVASGRSNARIQALETLVHLEPANARLFANLGGAQYERRNFQEAVRNYRAATILNPDDPRVWNALGYALAWTRDLNGARQAIEEYGKLAPGDVNVQDSLGEVSFNLGDFDSAAKYFQQAAQKSPAELLKAAEARLMTGDLGSADAFFAKYVGPAKGWRAAYEMAQWDFLTGRRTRAMAALEALMPTLGGEAKSLTLSRLSIWDLETGSSNAPGSWEVAGPIRLLLAGKFQDALPELEARYQRANPSNDGQIRLLLAWALVETGSIDRAATLIEMCPLPLSSGEPMVASLTFPRYFALRAAVFEKKGKLDEAKKNRELFLRYGGATK